MDEFLFVTGLKLFYRFFISFFWATNYKICYFNTQEFLPYFLILFTTHIFLMTKLLIRNHQDYIKLYLFKQQIFPTRIEDELSGTNSRGMVPTQLSHWSNGIYLAGSGQKLVGLSRAVQCLLLDSKPIFATFYDALFFISVFAKHFFSKESCLTDLILFKRKFNFRLQLCLFLFICISSLRSIKRP